LAAKPPHVILNEVKDLVFCKIDAELQKGGRSALVGGSLPSADPYGIVIADPESSSGQAAGVLIRKIPLVLWNHFGANGFS